MVITAHEEGIHLHNQNKIMKETEVIYFNL